MSLVDCLGALAVGLSLGLLGSGGSILTVPLLVYGLHQPEKVAIAGSLVIVGGIALAGGIVATARARVDWRSVQWFSIPGMLGAFAGARLSGSVSGAVQLLVFACVMVVAAWFMACSKITRPSTDLVAPRRHASRIGADGLAVGLLTGFVGVGGGFLIVPALVLRSRVPMQLAIGTSLIIITLNALAGLGTYLDMSGAVSLDWSVVCTFTAAGAVGSLTGQAIGARVPECHLRRAFAVVLLGVAAFTLWRYLPQLF